MLVKYRLTKFRDLVRRAVGARSQAKFAVDAGISHEHLNRLLNHEKIARPRMSTLLKIARVADDSITYYDLVHAIDDDVRDENGGDAETILNDKYRELKNKEAALEFKTAFGSHADKCYSILSKTIDSMAYPIVVNSVDVFMDSLLVKYENNCRVENISPLHISYYINDSLKYFGDEVKIQNASFCNVFLSVSYENASAESEMIIYTNRDASSEKKSSLTAVLGASMHMRNLYDVFGWYPALTNGMTIKAYEDQEHCDFFEYMKSAEYYMNLRSDAEYFSRQHGSALQFIHKFIVEDPEFKPTCVAGYGLYVSDSIHDKAYEFLINHKDTLFELTTSPQQYTDWKDTLLTLVNSGLNSGDEDDKLQCILSVFDDSTYDSIDDQLKYLICRIIRKETEFPVTYYASEYDEDYNAYGDLIDKRDAYILTDEDIAANSIRRTTLLNAFARYGRELGINKIDEMRYMTLTMFFGTPSRYTIRDCVYSDEDTDDDSDIDTSDWIPVSDAPEGMSMHRVLLKDGRIQVCLHIDKTNSWVACCKDWSKFADKYEKQDYQPKKK